MSHGRRAAVFLDRDGTIIEDVGYLAVPAEVRLLLYRKAAEELSVDLAASWWVGDRLRDVQPARAFGGRGIVLGPGAGAAFSAAPDLAAAVTGILAAR